MERIVRNGGRDRAEPKPETVFIFDIHGAVHEVVCDRSDRRPTPEPAEREAALSPSVIRRWLAGLALGLLGLWLLGEPATAAEPAGPSAVALKSW